MPAGEVRPLRAGPAVTDEAGQPASQTQLERVCGRYYWAVEYCPGQTVLEVACGTGQGLGLLDSAAGLVVGGDYSEINLQVARSTYAGTIPLARLDAQQLPFADRSFDVVILLETLYFLPDPESFLRQAVRLLRPGGWLLVSVINKDCPDYNPSPLYYNFYGTPEVSALLARYGFQVDCFGAIPMDRPSLRQRLLQPIKRLAVRLNLIPGTMRGRVWLKRLVFGRLVPLPRVITRESAPFRRPTPLSPGRPDHIHQVVLCAGRLAR